MFVWFHVPCLPPSVAGRPVAVEGGCIGLLSCGSLFRASPCSHASDPEPAVLFFCEGSATKVVHSARSGQVRGPFYLFGLFCVTPVRAAQTILSHTKYTHSHSGHAKARLIALFLHCFLLSSPCLALASSLTHAPCWFRGAGFVLSLRSKPSSQ